MGLAAAEEVGKTGAHIIIVGRTVAKLENAVADLKSKGISAEAYAGDVCNADSMNAVADYAASKGEICAVIHSAGVSPAMGEYKTIIEIDALGTINVDNAFLPKLKAGSCLLNVASMSAYMMPQQVYEFYPCAMENLDAFRDGLTKKIEELPDDKRKGMAYLISKQFDIWFSKMMAVKYGADGIRVCSISPGHFHTPMENFEGKEGTGYQMAIEGAMRRVGEACEIGRMMAFMVSPAASYLAGTDFLYDGGTIAALEAKGIIGNWLGTKY